MANGCKGRWHTTLYYLFRNGTAIPSPGQLETDGVIELEDEDAQGKFQGTHHKTGGRVKGQCNNDGGGQGVHVVNFERPEGSATFKYIGGKVNGDRITGGTFRVVGPQGALPGEGDSGTWESTREGPPGPPLDEHEPDEHAGEHADEHAYDHGRGKSGGVEQSK